MALGWLVCSPPNGLTSVGRSKALRFCPNWAICSSVAWEEGGVSKRTAALPLDPVAGERIRGGEVPLADTVEVAGASLELESHANLH